MIKDVCFLLRPGAVIVLLLTATLLGSAASVLADDPFIIDDDSSHWNADVGLMDGGVIPAAAAQLFRVYYGALGRLPDDGGFRWWSGEIAAGRHDLRSMAAGFIFSDEFQGIADANDDGQVSNEEFVTHMYEKVFGREPDAGGFEFWTRELASGSKTQTDVLVDMTQSNEYVELTLRPLAGYLPQGGSVPGDEGGTDDTGAPPSPDGSEYACLNRDLWEDGASHEYRMRRTDASGAQLEFTTRITMEHGVVFNGQKLQAAVIEQTSNASSEYSRQTELHEIIESPFTVLTVAIKLESTEPEGIVEFSPPYRQSLLRLGEEDVQDLKLTTSVVLAGGEKVSSQTWEVTRRRLYTGLEQITVPAGTFNACRLEETEESPSLAQPRRWINWLGVGNGLPLRSEFTGPEQDYSAELLSATINGVPLQ